MKAINFFRILIICLITARGSWAQEGAVLPVTVEEQGIEDAISRDDDETGYSESLEKLDELKRNPLNVNAASREELEQLRLLNDFQIFGLLDYRKNYGNLASLNELTFIPGFTEELIRQLTPLVTAKPPPQELPTLREAIRGGNSQFFLRLQRPLQQQAGYLDSSGYPGNPLKIFSRYSYSYQQLIRAGFTAEKDAGEKFPAGKGIGLMDFQSAFVQVRNMNNIKVLAVGDYNLRFGQGLVLWSGFATGKGADVINIRRRADGISPFTSSEENRFFRGAAATVRLNNTDFSFFFSTKKIDANIGRYDSVHMEVETFKSFRTDGLHLTEQDLLEKDAVGEMIVGGNINLNKNRLRVGTTWVHTRFEGILAPYRQGYSLYNPTGSSFTSGGMDYQYRIKNFLFFGEGAWSSTGGTAFLSGMLVKADPSFTLGMVLRNFSNKYNSFYGRPFSEGGKCSNEQGLYTGFQLILPKHFSINGYYDVYRFPWLKYEVDAPSQGKEGLIQLSWDPSLRLRMLLRYRSELKQINNDPVEAGLNTLQDCYRKSWRYNAMVQLSDAVRVQSRIDMNQLVLVGSSSENGILISQDLVWNPASSKTGVALRFALFDAGSYDNRIYSYEQDLLYAFSVPSYYGRGTRIYGMLSFTLLKRVDFWIKLARTRYSDRKNIGSGPTMIKGADRTDAGVQMRVRL
jgi:hypothetical protein